MSSAFDFGLPRNTYEAYLRNSMRKRHEVVIFHHDDADGCFAAAAAYAAIDSRSRWHGEAEVSVCNVRYVPVNYGYDPIAILAQLARMNEGTEIDVFVLDFAFDPELSDKIKSESGFFLTLDHHKTNEEMLKGKKYAHFDMNSSGAKMAFEYFFPEKEVPLAVTLADNRDLWLKTHGGEDAFHEYFLHARSVTYSGDHREFLNHLCELMFDGNATLEAIEKGNPFIDKRDSIIRSMTRPKVLSYTTIGGHPAVLFNAPVDQSDACEYLYHQDEFKHLIVGAYSFGPRGAIFSLRCHESLGLDLAELASSHYGGGGHPRAAGFRTSLERGINILQDKEKWCMCWPSAAVDQALELSKDNSELIALLCEIPYSLRSRATVEKDKNWLQVLPYATVVDQSTGKIFTYRRPAGGGESRLYGNTSIGLGGHVDSLPKDKGSVCGHLGDETGRELDEEVGLKVTMEKNLLGSTSRAEMIGFDIYRGHFKVLRIKETDVESVHLGLAFRVEVPDASHLAKINLKEVQDPRWLTKEELKAELAAGGPFEVWSAKLIETM